MRDEGNLRNFCVGNSTLISGRGDFQRHHTTVQHLWNGRCLADCALLDPIAFPFVEGSGSCLPRAHYVRYRGRDGSPSPYCGGSENPPATETLRLHDVRNDVL